MRVGKTVGKWVGIGLCLMAATGDAGYAQRGGPGRGGRGPMGPGRDPAFAEDRNVFQFLLANREKIRREVKLRDDGVETRTESDDPQVAKQIQVHVAAMYRRVEQQRPIHLRDPLFAEIFRHAKQIEMKFEKTPRGVRVVETSEDPYVAKLIQEHARVVSRFIKYGHEEVHRNHPLPPRP